MNQPKASYNLKIIFCGTGGVGKTSLVRRYIENKFEHRYLMTVGMEPSNKIIKIGDDYVNLVIFDVAGQKRFEIMRNVFFRGTHGAVLVFDITRPNQTLEDLFTWKKQIQRRVGDRVPLLLAANKIDVKEEFNYDKEFVEDIIEQLNGFKYLETSAATGKNVDVMFKELAKEALKRQGIEL